MDRVSRILRGAWGPRCGRATDAVLSVEQVVARLVQENRWPPFMYGRNLSARVVRTDHRNGVDRAARHGRVTALWGLRRRSTWCGRRERCPMLGARQVIVYSDWRAI